MLDPKYKELVTQAIEASEKMMQEFTGRADLQHNFNMNAIRMLQFQQNWLTRELAIFHAFEAAAKDRTLTDEDMQQMGNELHELREEYKKELIAILPPNSELATSLPDQKSAEEEVVNKASAGLPH